LGRDLSTGKALLIGSTIAAIAVIAAEMIIHLILKVRINTVFQFILPLGSLFAGSALVQAMYEIANFEKYLKVSAVTCVISFLIAFMIPRSDLIVQGHTGNSIGAMGNYQEVGGDNGFWIFALLFVAIYTLCLTVISLRKLARKR